MKFKLPFKKKQQQQPYKEMNAVKEKVELIAPSENDFTQLIKDTTNNPADLVIKSIPPNLTLIYINNLVNDQTLNEHIITNLQNNFFETPEAIWPILSIPEVNISSQLEETIASLLNGSVLIYVNGYSQVVLAPIPKRESRSLSTPENESQVIGAQVGFNESLSTNISLIRRYIISPNLCNEELKVGKRTHTSLSLLYMNGIASDQMVNTLRQRIQDVDVDSLLDSAVLLEMIDDNTLSPFPQMLLTERPDRFCDGLLNGKLGIIVEGSSLAIVCPIAFVEFFESREDQNLRWQVATFARLLRFTAIFLSVFLTPIYVGALTFHYEVIPQALLVPLSESRALVPFPPVFEALLLELIIELLREAGARLPTKIGQTIGIVGGIVIGTAAVQAGITSNILLIFVALSALASFTTPSYTMGNVIRLIRFPIILIAGFWGFYGIMLAFCFILIHLLRQSSLGAPYLSPYYPPRLKDMRDSIIKFPLPFVAKRASLTRPADQEKFDPEPVKPEKS
ncbi:spore germination protein [Psychrobacillus lasiicapitis]|uniref:Spore germination protein n=1 Tax=Psychrobacillus lasiicapitis TaxID=1636719 RepID=A0A544TGZ0_9BACI|nr:spore germination protein [Psychrobacillus lasiicapitis]TQR16724.1 spore germination protein [Psychrobacillus lasiicapitis]GGA27775.1 spore germination protein [Psychrobacillus lasiicapitis]